MTEAPSPPSAPARPVLIGRLGPRFETPPPTRRGSQPRGEFRDPAAQRARIEASFRTASTALQEQVRLSESIPSSDPHLVLVLVAMEVSVDLTVVAQRLGLDVLLDIDDDVDEDDVYASASEGSIRPSSLYAVAVNAAAIDALLLAWRRWQRGEGFAWGTAQLRGLFEQLKDVRVWGPEDRLKLAPWRVALAGSLPDLMHKVEIELWYSGNALRRAAARRSVAAQLEIDGGRVLRESELSEIGYHALACEVPSSLLLSLADGNYSECLSVRSHDVMYFRATGQHLTEIDEGSDLSEAPGEAELPQGTPVICLLDGVPVANHKLLQDRLLVHDPDDHAAAAALTDRRHGTAMASVAVWGDLAQGGPPAKRPILLRPVLVPASSTVGNVEEFAENVLIPDLMERVFRELFAEDGEAREAARDVAIVSISIGDPSAPFASLMSSWARALDYLSDRFGVLIIVSAGNHSTLDLGDVEARALPSMSPSDRRAAITTALEAQRLSRTLLSPAEAINVVTVGALHQDAATPPGGTYRIDPLGDGPAISPVSAMGSGLHRSIKPEVAAPGGRVTFVVPFDGSTTLALGHTSLGPGIRVAGPASAAATTHTTGTSPAAALVARQAGRIAEMVEQLLPSDRDRHDRAVAIKALLVHGARTPAGLDLPLEVQHASVGHGELARDLTEGCQPHEATILYLGSLRAGQSQRLSVPLPDGMAALGVKRVTATLAWLSPVNWRHRQYRRAKLDFATPTGSNFPPLKKATDVPASASKRGATTVQHGVWETQGSIAAGLGDELSIEVVCQEQAGGLAGDEVPYAVALSLWVAPELSVDVYTQVAQQVQSRSVVRPVIR